LPSPRGKGRWDLAVIGGGDPNISGRFYGGDTVGAFRRWAAVLKARGVTAVERVVLDDTLFDAALVHPNWPADQRDKWYEAPVNALSINDNCVNVHVAPGPAGGAARVWLEPPGAGIALSGSIRTTASKKAHRYSLERFIDPDGSMRIHADGAYWTKAPERIVYRTLADPTQVFGNALAHALREEGIGVAGPVVRAGLTTSRGAARRGFHCDLVHVSRLGATAAVANTRSQGLYAECLFKLLGAYALTPKVTTPHPPRQGSWESGREELQRWLAARGLPAAGCVFDDGSGLSKQNRLTVFTLAHVLALMHRVYGARFRETLALAGEDEGTLHRRMQNTPADGRIHAKTGYVAGASALSGYAETDSGHLLAFAILMNGFRSGHLWKARLAQDKLCIRMVEY
jgi:D-alanyl-D-alanine carboxypeptidase/D-alanyl-D-alanine-endopeptidase (penicillin-binding protein 4)